MLYEKIIYLCVMLKKEINDILLGVQNGDIEIGEASNQLVDIKVNFQLPHIDIIENSLDRLMIIRGEYPTRVRNPVYQEERILAVDLVKHVLLLI